MRELMDWMIAAKIAKNDFNAAAIVNGLKLHELPDDDARKARVMLYRNWRNAGEKSKTAFVKAIAGDDILPEDTPPMFDVAMLSIPENQDN